MFFLLYLLSGMLAGLLAGLLGIGGGIIIVPALLYIFTLQHMHPDITMHMAAGTSLAIMVLTSISSICAHHYRGNVYWPIFLKLVPSIIVGVIIGATCAHFVNTRIIEIVFGIFLLLVSLRIFFHLTPSGHKELPSGLTLNSAGLIIGGKSGFLGVGGGSIIIPFLLYFNIPMHKASGTCAACSFIIALVGSISFILLGLKVNAGPNYLGYIYLPAFINVALTSIIFAPIGAWLGSKFSVTVLKKIFALFLFLTSISLLW